MRLFLALALLLFVAALPAQRKLLIERLNSAKNLALYEGDRLEFLLYGEEETFDRGTIQELRADIQAIVINERIIPLKDIEMLRQSRGIAKAAGYSLQDLRRGLGLLCRRGLQHRWRPKYAGQRGRRYRGGGGYRRRLPDPQGIRNPQTADGRQLPAAGGGRDVLSCAARVLW